MEINGTDIALGLVDYSWDALAKTSVVGSCSGIKFWMATSKFYFIQH